MISYILSICTFIEYKPSVIEKQWLQHDVTGQICEIAETVSQQEGWNSVLRNDRFFMSSFVENGETKYIEPLTGVGRHPHANIGCKFNKKVSVMDTSYIKLHNYCHLNNSHNYTKVVMFDMGCSIYGRGNTRAASGYGPSIPLFMRWYEHKCLSVDEVWAWEARPIKHWWESVPTDIKMKIKFYNTPVSVSELTESFKYVSQSDYVIIKLDIDNTEVEMQLIQVIIDHSIFVDELFFEYHYYMDGMNFGWGNLTKYMHIHNATSAISLMYKLRTLGIRSHFWV